MAYFTKGVFAPDPWAETTPPPSDRRLIDLATWQEQRTVRGSLPPLLGLALDPGFAVEGLADDIKQFALITVSFPKFTDGRAYSMAWLLRSRLGYTGELRAVGDILFDEMQFMLRCGFDAFQIEDANTINLLKSGRRSMIDRFYQPGLEPEVPEGTRPWARRLVTVPGGNLA